MMHIGENSKGSFDERVNGGDEEESFGYVTDAGTESREIGLILPQGVRSGQIISFGTYSLNLCHETPSVLLALRVMNETVGSSDKVRGAGSIIRCGSGV